MTATRIVNPDTGGAKDSKEQRMDLLPYDALMAISEVFHHGATKYGDRNWERGYAWSLSFAALQRHLAAWWQGENVDPESGLSHLQHAGFHVLALMANVTRPNGEDDRPRPRENAGAELAALITEMNRHSDPNVDVGTIIDEVKQSKQLGLPGGAGSWHQYNPDNYTNTYRK